MPRSGHLADTPPSVFAPGQTKGPRLRAFLRRAGSTTAKIGSSPGIHRPIA
jgi:hypothetical protein